MGQFLGAAGPVEEEIKATLEVAEQCYLAEGDPAQQPEEPSSQSNNPDPTAEDLPALTYQSLGVYPFFLSIDRLREFVGLSPSDDQGPAWPLTHPKLASNFTPHDYQVGAVVSYLSTVFADEVYDGDDPMDGNDTHLAASELGRTQARSNGGIYGTAQLLNDEMGLGKTFQAIMVILLLMHHSFELPEIHKASDPEQAWSKTPALFDRRRAYLYDDKQQAEPFSFPLVTEMASFPAPLHKLEYFLPLFDRKGALGAVASPYLPYLVIVPPALYTQWRKDLVNIVDPAKVKILYVTSVESTEATRLPLFKEFRDSATRTDPPEHRTIILTTYQVSLHGRLTSPLRPRC